MPVWLTGLLETIGGLQGLQALDLSWCSGLTGLPESLLPFRGRLGISADRGRLGISADSFDALIGRELAVEFSCPAGGTRRQ